MITPQFINECINGSESAIQALVRAHQRGVYQIALTVIDEGMSSVDEAAAQAEIATRDTFIAAVDQMNGYRDDIPFTTWLYRIAITVSQRRARRWKLARILDRFLGIFSTHSNNSFNEPAISAPREAGEVFLAVRRLSPRLRLPVVLRYYHDFSPAEIARLLHLREGAVHARLDAARDKIASLPAFTAEG